MSSTLLPVNRVLCSLAVAATALLAAPAARAELVWYSEVTGGYASSLIANSVLTNGPLGGTTIASNLSTYRGADNFYLGFAQPNGSMAWYGANGGAYIGVASAPNLSGGPVSGSVANNPKLLGVDDNSLAYYVDAGKAVAYDDYLFGTHNVFFSNLGYTNFTGGGVLSGQPVSLGIGLKTVNGYTDINQQYLMAVAGDGTLDHYYLPNGAYVNFPGHGNWTTFSSGPIAGLNLTTLNGAAIGSVGTTSYRFLGTSGDAMYFDVTTAAVPEPGTYALMAGGLGLLALAARRRRTAA